MYQIVLFLHLFVCIVLIALVLLQQGKGAEAGAGFAGGASQTVFGSQGSGSFLLKITGGFALAFFITCLTLGYIASREARQSKVIKVNSMKQLPQHPVRSTKQ